MLSDLTLRGSSQFGMYDVHTITLLSQFRSLHIHYIPISEDQRLQFIQAPSSYELTLFHFNKQNNAYILPVVAE